MCYLFWDINEENGGSAWVSRMPRSCIYATALLMMIGHDLGKNTYYAFSGSVVFDKFAEISHMTNLVAFSTAERKLLLSRQLHLPGSELPDRTPCRTLVNLSFGYPIISRSTDLKSAFVPVAQEDRLSLHISNSVT